MTKTQLIEKCNRYYELEKMIAELEVEKKEIQVILKDELEKKKVDELDIDKYHFSNKMSKPKTLFDSTEFAKKHPKLFKEFTKEGKASTRFLFRLIK